MLKFLMACAIGRGNDRRKAGLTGLADLFGDRKSGIALRKPPEEGVRIVRLGVEKRHKIKKLSIRQSTRRPAVLFLHGIGHVLTGNAALRRLCRVFACDRGQERGALSRRDVDGANGRFQEILVCDPFESWRELQLDWR
jgi:hypothetical protein